MFSRLKTNFLFSLSTVKTSLLTRFNDYLDDHVLAWNITLAQDCTHETSLTTGMGLSLAVRVGPVEVNEASS